MLTGLASTSAGSSTSAPGENPQIDVAGVRDTVRRLASLYYKQVQAVCNQSASQAEIEQSKCELSNKLSQTELSIQRLARGLKECEEARLQVKQLEADRNGLTTQLNKLQNDLSKAEAELNPLQASIKHQEDAAKPLAIEITRLEMRFESIKQLLALNASSIDCTALLGRVQKFFSVVKGLDAGDAAKRIADWESEANNSNMARFAKHAAIELTETLREAAKNMMQCESLDEFQGELQKAQKDFLTKLDNKIQRQSTVIDMKGNLGQAFASIMATALLLRAALRIHQLIRNNEEIPPAEAAFALLVCVAYSVLNSSIGRSIREQHNNWGAFTSQVNKLTREECNKKGQQLANHHARLHEQDKTLYREWRASTATGSEQEVPQASKNFVEFFEERAPIKILSALREQKLRDLKLHSFDQLEDASRSVAHALDEKRSAHANVRTQTRELRTKFKQSKDLVVSLNDSLKHGGGRKLLDDIEAIEQTLKQKQIKDVDPAELDELNETQQALLKQVSLLGVQARNKEQAFRAELAQIANEMTRLSLSDAEINAASDQVCRAMGWNKNHFNVMWNRHVGLGPDQLRARMSGRTVSGSLGDKVPGLTGGQDASSYGTPAMALHALYDVADAMRSGELANDGSVDEVLEHGQPVGISALAPRGKIRTVSGTLVTLSPPHQ